MSVNKVCVAVLYQSKTAVLRLSQSWLERVDPHSTQGGGCVRSGFNKVYGGLLEWNTFNAGTDQTWLEGTNPLKHGGGGMMHNVSE